MATRNGNGKQHSDRLGRVRRFDDLPDSAFLDKHEVLAVYPFKEAHPLGGCAPGTLSRPGKIACWRKTERLARRHT